MAEKGPSFFGSFLSGAALGGIAAFLLTPFTGEEARKKAQEKLDELKKISSDLCDNVNDNKEEVITKTIDAIEEGILKLTSAVEEAKKASEEKRRELEEE